MELGNIVEYIDRQRILCAVVLEIKHQRLKLLTETSKEVNLSVGRLLHRDNARIDPSIGRTRIVDTLRAVAHKRKALIEKVLIRELWEVLNSEQQWIDLETMTVFCFPDAPNGDHQSAVVRAFFGDRLYFKFNPDRFFPNSVEQVERIIAQRQAEARRKRIIEDGGEWLRRMLTKNGSVGPDNDETGSAEYLAVLKSYYLFEKESPDCSLAQGMLDRAGLDRSTDLFPFLAQQNVFTEDENIDLLRLEIPVQFPDEVQARAAALVASGRIERAAGRRQDLTHLNLFTIDGQATLDFDDALSLETTPEGNRLGIHIVDVAHFVQRGGPVAREFHLYGRPEDPHAASQPGRGSLQPEGGGDPPGHQYLDRLDPRVGHPEIPDFSEFCAGQGAAHLF
jgi:exoribonuclease II